MKDEIKEILDNIQEVINDSIKNNYYDLTINRLALSNIKNKLENYITNLQEENDYYFKKNNELSTLNTLLRSDRDNYKSRNEKAIEYMKNAGCYEEDTKNFCTDIYGDELINLLKILNGGDEE